MRYVAWVTKPSKRHRTYRAFFRDHNGELRSITAFRSRRASLNLAKTLYEVCEIIASGGDIPTDEARWLRDQLDDQRRAKLIEWGILSARHVMAGKSMIEHLADWRDNLEAEGTKPQHHDQQHMRASAVLVAECGYILYAEIDPVRVQEAASSLARRRGWSKQTVAHYLKACSQFSRWMFKTGRFGRDQLQTLSIKQPNRAEQSHPRRALTPQEASILIESTRRSATIRGHMTGVERALIYQLVLFETGFRAGTIRSLRVFDFDLRSVPPVVTGRIKGGRDLTIPLSCDILNGLDRHLSGRPGDDLAFKCPTVSWFADMLKADLDEAAIPYKRYGKAVDFHALRHSFATMASRVMDPRTLQEIMGHTDIRITMRYYTHRLTDDLAAAKAGLPRHECDVECGANAPESILKRQNIEVPRHQKTGSLAS